MLRLWFNVISTKLEVNNADNLAIDIRGTRQRDDNNMDARVLMVTMLLSSLCLSLSINSLTDQLTQHDSLPFGRGKD